MCSKCKEEIPHREQSISCCECEYPYHIGNCAGISETTLKTKGEAYRKAWKCPTCRAAKLKGGATSKQRQDGDMWVLLAAMNEKLDNLLALKETVGNIEASVQVMSDKYDEILSHITEQKQDIKDLKRRVEKIENANKKDELSKMKTELHELEWRSRRLNLEFHGVPKTDGEDLLNKVNEVARSLDVSALNISDVAAIHRLPSKSDRTPGIIVRFVSQLTRDLWLSRKARLRTIGNKLYINENMTKQNRELLAKAKDWAKSADFTYVWHKDGKIFVRRQSGERAFVIRCEDDLQAIVS